MKKRRLAREVVLEFLVKAFSMVDMGGDVAWNELKDLAVREFGVDLEQLSERIDVRYDS